MADLFGIGSAADAATQFAMFMAQMNALGQARNLYGQQGQWQADKARDIWNQYYPQLQQQYQFGAQEFLNPFQQYQSMVDTYGPQFAYDMFKSPSMTSFENQNILDAGSGQRNAITNLNALAQQNLGTGYQTARQILAGGGWTPGYQEAQDRATEMARGQGDVLGGLSGMTGDILGQRGQYDTTRMMEALGGKIMGQEGATPELLALQQAGLGGIGARGWTPQTSELYSMARGQAQTDPLNILANPQARNMVDLAVSQAASKVDDSARAAFARAQQRGGKGALAAGARNEMAAEFQEEKLKAMEAARAQALSQVSQLGAGQQQLGMAGMGQGIGAAQSAEQLALQELLGGQQGIQSRLTAGGQLAGAGGGLAAQRLGLGIQGGQTFQQGQLGGVNALTNINQAMNQYALGGGGLMANLLGQSAGATQGAGSLAQMLGNLGIQQGTLGMQRYNTLMPQIQAGIANKYQSLQLPYQMYTQGLGNMGNLWGTFNQGANTYANLLGEAYRTQAGAYPEFQAFRPMFQALDQSGFGRPWQTQTSGPQINQPAVNPPAGGYGGGGSAGF